MLLDAVRLATSPPRAGGKRRSEVTVSEVDAGAPSSGWSRSAKRGTTASGRSATRRRPASPRPGDALGGHALCELRLPAWGSAQIVIESARGRRQADEALVHQLVQVSDGRVVGGYSLVERHRGHGF